jgi:hypothetical protein
MAIARKPSPRKLSAGARVISDLSAIERVRLEQALRMKDGYVLNFTNRSFADFVLFSTGLDINDPKYRGAGDSKANRLRSFWRQENNYTVGKLLGDFFEAWETLGGDGRPPEDCLRIVSRLKADSPVPDVEYLGPISEEKTLDTLANAVREALKRNEPEMGLDRLHTYAVKYLRMVCEKHGISTERGKPLHSLIGEYVKVLRQKGKIESVMTERILKSSISIIEAFGEIRNEQSFAHDNPILNYDESILVLSHVTSLIRFIQAIESRKGPRAKETA